MLIKRLLSRRSMLRGAFGGAAITVGLPFLDCFLDDNGVALADGSPIPTRFATWFQGLGFNQGFWEPEAVGPNYEMRPLLAALKPLKDKVNIYSGLQVLLDGKPAEPHTTGPQAILNGGIPHGDAQLLPSVDSLIADVIGARTRFRSLEASCDGTSRSYSCRGGAIFNASESDPAALYTRIFGPEFVDPNAAAFTPDPRMLARRSVLSVVTDQRQAVMKQIGASDKVRLDEYYTSLRSLEQQIDLSLQKPAPLEACSVAERPKEGPASTLVDDAQANHQLFSRLLAHALTCGQTRVVNVMLSVSASGLRLPGSAQTYHIYTHEEAIDPKLGYQPTVAQFESKVIETFAAFLTEMQNVREGDSSLLDRMLVFFSTDTGSAKVHSLTNIPLITAGSAGGRIKTGVHVQEKGDVVTRVGLTVQQAMGVPISAWGTDSNRTSKPISEVMA